MTINFVLLADLIDLLLQPDLIILNHAPLSPAKSHVVGHETLFSHTVGAHSSRIAALNASSQRVSRRAT
jgi:hypothetical protein